jgi:SAM-dependent methyltransferase
MPKMPAANSKENLEKDFRKEWDHRAHENWRQFVWAEASASEEIFRNSGERDYERFVRRFLSAIRMDPAKQVALEIGCGAGRVSEFLSRDFRGLVAVDVSREMLNIGRKRVDAENVLWLCNDGKSLKAVSDASVDFVFSYGVFQQFPDAGRVADYVRETARVLKPGGWFVFQVMNQPHLSVGRLVATLIFSHRLHVPRIRIYWLGALEACPIRLGAIRKACADSGLELFRVLHRWTQNTWIWARKTA